MPPSTSTVARVLEGNLCAGCGLCAALAPDALTMQYSSEGFLRPAGTGDVGAGAESAIAAACPGAGLRLEHRNTNDDRLWGPYVAMWSGYATNSALRRNASSGGALSALLVHLVESCWVDAVIQTGPDPELPLGNRTTISRTPDEILANAASRYAPSAPLTDLETHLASDETFAFVGKPCDVAALRALGRHDARVAVRFPFLISFFCAGVPSLAGAREVLDRLGVKESDLAAFRFRGDGWPGFATATRRDGSRECMSYADSWGGVLSRHVQLRCRICPDGTGGFADVACADAWETDARGYPLFEERDGVSLVVARTDKGEAVIRSATAAGLLALEAFEVADLERMQPGQTCKRRHVLARLAALRMLARPTPVYRGFHLRRNAREAGARSTLRSFFGTLRRAIRGRL
jgi:coenzyme F420 hydrogenase subunit beta